MEWFSFKTPPDSIGRQHPIWVYSRRGNKVQLGYFSNGSFYDMLGSGIPCYHWSYVVVPEPPKEKTTNLSQQGTQC